jgi:acetolactate synthase I/II/III large subunit
MKASDLFVKILEQKWVKIIYWVPWEENLDLLDSIGKSSIELILTRNEQTAVFMAATYWRFTGEPGIALATLWPGATNMVTGVAYAQLGGLPVIVITGQKPIKKSKQGQFQIIDVVAMMKPITKYATSIVSPSRIPYILDNAFKIASGERPGAVHIELPEDIAWEDSGSDFFPLLVKQDRDDFKIRRPQIDEKTLLNLKTIIEKASSPIVLIGAWANRKRISKYLTHFIEKYNIPFFTSQMGKWVVDESLPQFLWTAALTSGDYLHKAIEKSDLIISVGYDPIEKPTALMGFWGTPNIHINFYEAHIDEVYTPFFEVIGDIGNTFWQLSETEINTKNWNFETIYQEKDKYLHILASNFKEENMWGNILWPRQLASELREVLKPSDILALDNGLYKVWIARNYPCYEPNTLLLDNALATMGAGLASAMEAKRINPDKSVVCVTGDGWLVMNLGDLETAVRLKLNLVVIVLNNHSYGMIKWKQNGFWLKEWGLDFGNPDFVKLAESFWAKGYKVGKSEFKSTLEKAIQETGLILLDVDFEYPKDIK